MKKLLAIFTALIFTAGMAISQTNVATVDQVGDGNEAEVLQTGNLNTAAVDQYGKNTSVVDQEGVNNDATVNQGEDGKPVTNSDTQSWRYGAFIEQAGQDNIAAINITRGDGTYQDGGSSNGARIEQEGISNEAYQDISNSHQKTTDWDRMGVHIKQDGDDNFAKQETFRSFGTHGSGGVIIDQVGNENEARQYIVGGRQNVTEIFQTGDNNTYTGFENSDIADVLDMDWAFKPAGEDFSQFQRGEGNELRLNITGNNNTTAQYQEGDVWGYSYNEANINIEGSDNEAAQGQLGTNNVADIMVIGDLNKAGIQQTGDFHDADINQTGNGNFSTIIQQN